MQQHRVKIRKLTRVAGAFIHFLKFVHCDNDSTATFGNVIAAYPSVVGKGFSNSREEIRHTPILFFP
jgi:hypothetical protein